MFILFSSPPPSTHLLLFSVEPVCQPGECCLVLKVGEWGGAGWERHGQLVTQPHSPKPRLLLAVIQPGLRGREAGPMPPSGSSQVEGEERTGHGDNGEQTQRVNREEVSCVIDLQGVWHPLP